MTVQAEVTTCAKCGSRNIAQLDDSSWECHDCGEDWEDSSSDERYPCERCGTETDHSDLSADSGLCSTCESHNESRVTL